MATQEHARPFVGQGEEATFEPVRSSVKLTRNAKGESQWEIKVRVGDTDLEVAYAREVAVSEYRELEREFLGGGR